jgi:hypothetical protein
MKGMFLFAGGTGLASGTVITSADATGGAVAAFGHKRRDEPSKSKSPAADIHSGRDGSRNQYETGAY